MCMLLGGKIGPIAVHSCYRAEIIMCFDIVHTDLCGPMDSITSNGNRYAMTVIDGFSRFFVTYLLKNKSEAAGRLKDM